CLSGARGLPQDRSIWRYHVRIDPEDPPRPASRYLARFTFRRLPDVLLCVRDVRETPFIEPAHDHVEGHAQQRKQLQTARRGRREQKKRRSARRIHYPPSSLPGSRPNFSSSACSSSVSEMA